MSRALRQVQREINPLEKKGRNPVKDVVKTSAKARETRKPRDISKAQQAHTKAISYSERHGYPRLIKQLQKHKTKLPRPIRLQKKSKGKSAP
jgi:hypothetical protein